LLQANKGDKFTDPKLSHNRSYSLAYADGPYGMLLSSAFFDRNPGLPFKNFSIGFQPEIGSVSIPTYEGLLKFMSLDEIQSGFPSRNGRESNATAWNYHKFLPWTTQQQNTETYDHIYAYFAPNLTVDAQDWTAAAQVAAHAQYQSLFNGFISYIFDYTTSVVMWKTQSPWPSLRGFLYDWYLESTGTLRGVRAALGTAVSIVFDPQQWRLRIVNRQVFPVTRCANSPIGARYTWIDLHGTAVSSGEALLSVSSLPAMSARLLDDPGDGLKWPKNCTAVCFLCLQEIGNRAAARPVAKWHWLTDPGLGDASDYSQLGELRKRQGGNVTLDLESCVVHKEGLRLDLRLHVDSGAPDVLFYPTISLQRVDGGSQLLPVTDSKETDVVITPGANQRRRLQTSATVGAGELIRAILTSWNSPEVYQDVICTGLEVQPSSQVELTTT
jgi:hypothetical protein